MTSEKHHKKTNSGHLIEISNEFSRTQHEQPFIKAYKADILIRGSGSRTWGK